MTTLAADGISLSFDVRTGLIERFTVIDGTEQISPLNRAPWVGTDEALADGLAPHMYTLGGDFFCAPFGQETDGVPLHGWPANSHWSILEQSSNHLAARLDKTVNGAQLIKELWLCPGHPFVYQRHRFIGGTGRVPVANHANVALPNGGLIRTSAKQAWMTPPQPLEDDPKRGRSGLAYPARCTDPTAFTSVDGTTDLTRYPWFPRHEDFVIGVEAPGHTLGWTAVTRPTEGDLFLSVRCAAALPFTMLWHSNGGRDYAPWSGRHFGCLGVEEGAADHVLGPEREGSLPGPGALQLTRDGSVEVLHAIGAISWPSGSAVKSVDYSKGVLTVTGDCGVRRRVRGLFE
ncbi:hypothetical protein [Ruegeria arenilitoris]|uniref:hypothetical protein n=1 Tax=Ruegeria arenilitoris TaxID=1173585 RepID=UPI00147C8852|nr:hypothetical protein [Ruegeria arenilitoris]